MSKGKISIRTQRLSTTKVPLPKVTVSKVSKPYVSRRFQDPFSPVPGKLSSPADKPVNMATSALTTPPDIPKVKKSLKFR